MTQTSEDLRRQRVARALSRRAADELLIEAIFGDVLFGRLVRRDEDVPRVARAPLAGLPRPTTEPL